MEKPSLKERFQYWFDNRMAKGSGSLIGILLRWSAVFVVFVVVVMTYVTKDSGSFFANLWNGFVTMINAWMPEYVPDPENPPQLLSLIFNAIIAIYGILFTSVLIGSITSMIEEKIDSLRKGDTPVLEEGHIIVIGFYSGEYTLLNELILAAGTEKRIIVVAGEAELKEMEQLIRDNVEIPKNVRVICRSLDIFDPSALSRLSPKESSSIIISPTSNQRAVKILLALSTLIDETDQTRVNAIIYKDEFMVPTRMADKHRISILQTNDTIAKVIARACIQPGLSEVFTEIFNFEGNEFYFDAVEALEGKTFRECVLRMDQATPIGFLRDSTTCLNPSGDAVLQKGDRIIYLSPEHHYYQIMPLPEADPTIADKKSDYHKRRNKKVCIIGTNKMLTTILKALPLNVKDVLIINPGAEKEEELQAAFPQRGIRFRKADLLKEEEVLPIVQEYHHVILLSRHSDDDDKDDMKTSFQLLRMRDIRERNQIRFNITVEMHRESNQNLIASNDHSDFVVASNMASLFLAQLSENSELRPLFAEILSNEGNEIILMKAKHLQAAGTYTVRQLREIALQNGYIFIGYRTEDYDYVMNPGLNESVTLEPYQFLVLSGHGAS